MKLYPTSSDFEMIGGQNNVARILSQFTNDCLEVTVGAIWASYSSEISPTEKAKQSN
jgi:hypothetical protein